MQSFLTEMKIDCKTVEQPAFACPPVFLLTVAPIEKGPLFFKIGHLTGYRWCLQFSRQWFHN
jgi:hypothetical protein